jgi:hypothetical protein
MELWKEHDDNARNTHSSGLDGPNRNLRFYTEMRPAQEDSDARETRYIYISSTKVSNKHHKLLDIYT